MDDEKCMGLLRTRNNTAAITCRMNHTSKSGSGTNVTSRIVKKAIPKAIADHKIFKYFSIFLRVTAIFGAGSICTHVCVNELYIIQDNYV